ncbi:Cyanovirin-N [Morchella snyderi]|nr:Cyanovirin-N [Morchella snyderi]
MQITSISPFHTSSREPRLERRGDRTFLVCEARRKDNTWTRAELDLDSIVGNNDGKFDTTGKGSNFTQSAQNIRLERGHDGLPVLHASLANCAGEWKDVTTHPAEWIMNADGRLRFGRQRDLRAFEVIADDRTFFMCQSQRPDGSWGEAKMDLDKFIGNDDGKFDVSGGGTSFTQSARHIKMKYGGAGGDHPILVADLKDMEGEWRAGEVDLLEVLKNVSGALEFRGKNQHGPQ